MRIAAPRLLKSNALSLDFGLTPYARDDSSKNCDNLKR